MKIGIITYWTTSNNYGQLLQCFALQQALRGMGHDSFLIRYDPFSAAKPFTKRLFSLTPDIILSLISGKYRSEKEQRAHIAEMDVLRDFDKFRSDYLEMGDRSYASIFELRSDPPEADAYICGSDQVWHNSLSDSETPAWFLDFGDARRISYAASIGRNLADSEIPLFKGFLERFSSISLREKTSTDLCRSLGFEHAQTVLDPTLLIDAGQYPVDAIKDPDEKYVFAYIVNVVERNAALWDSVRRYVAHRGMKVLPVYSSGYCTCVEFLKSEYESTWPSVPQWLGMLSKASGVITTSFHGVALSIVMHKQFLSIPLGATQAPANDRIRTLLDALGLTDRILTNGEEYSSKMDAKIDWEQVDAKLELQRRKSIEYLDFALSKDCAHA